MIGVILFVSPFLLVLIPIAVADWIRNAKTYRTRVSLWDRLCLVLPLMVIDRIFRIIEWRMDHEEKMRIPEDTNPLLLILFLLVALLYWRIWRCGKFGIFIGLSHLALALITAYLVAFINAMP